MKQLAGIAALALGIAFVAVAWAAKDASISPRQGGMVHERYAAAGSAEVPDFRKHVVPMMGRMGCNARACHGSFQGQGGFRLSLFGYDFQADHQALTGGTSARVDVKNPLESLVLDHPTSADHGGGKRFAPGSWQYNVLRRWIEGGAHGTVPHAPQLARLDVQPASIVFSRPGEQVPLKVTAVWSDGSQEVVTDISRFRTNDETIAEVSEDGIVTARGKGDSHIVAFYDNGVAPVVVMMPVSDQTGDRYPDLEARTTIDRFVLEKLRTLGIVPAAVCDDAQFLRRVSLDLTGTLPSPDEIRAFLADRAPQKRLRKIDELLETPAYAAWWTTKFCDWTGNAPDQQIEPIYRGTEAGRWYDWIYCRLKDNVPYDRIVEGMLLAVSRSSPQQSYVDYCKEMSSCTRSPDEFAKREQMPYYWTRRNMTKPEDRAISVSYAFLGVRLQCAQCHKHPFDQWTQQDFQQFGAFFNGLRFGVQPRDAAQRQGMIAALGGDRGKTVQREFREKVAAKVKQGEPVPWSELFLAPAGAGGRNARPNKRKLVSSPTTVTPKLLGAEEVPASKYPDPRQAVMEWMRRKDNPYFASAIVNRVWAAYFGHGIIDPPDDANLANPPSNRPLLDYLSQEFVAHGYDLKWLHRTVLASDAYQRAWEPNDGNRLDERNFSRMIPRRLPAEVVLDAVTLCSMSSERLNAARIDLSGRAIGATPGDYRNKNGNNVLLASFGKPARQTTCDCERSNDATLLQTVMIENDPALLRQLESSPWLRQLGLQQNAGRFDKQRRLATKPQQAPAVQQTKLIEEAFLRTVSRLPNTGEAATAAETLAAAPSPAVGLRELLWTLINTKEFIVNH